MLEKSILNKIREYLKTEYGATVHKYHGGFGGETGHSDLYGCLPGGRAYFIEVKSPTAKHDLSREKYQWAFMYSEQLNGALVGFARSLEDVDRIMNGEDMLIKPICNPQK